VVTKANIVETLSTLDKPDILWSSEGQEQNPPKGEAEVRGQESYNTLIAACKACNLVDTLNGPGPFTVFAPTDSAFKALGPKLDALLKDIPQLTKILTYHVVPGKFTLDQITKDLPTVNGASLKFKRAFRKTFVDDAVVGLAPEGASASVTYPVDLACDNGVIHSIDQVLIPK
jgi:uncharacterized surface protein with fasciclin (FAS1) repeats